MNYIAYFLPLLLIGNCHSDSDGKRWVWKDGKRRNDDRHYTSLVVSDRQYTGDVIGSLKPLFQPSSNYGGSVQETNENLKYEVQEPQYEMSSAHRPIVRPSVIYPKPEGIYRPEGSQSGYRPFVRPTENGFRPGGNGLQIIPGPEGLRPSTGTNGRPILVGPVPSWEQENPNRYRDYDKCKCVHSFNCNTPGIKFGSCDVDKQYCCYKARGEMGQGPASRPVHVNVYQKPRPVLAGPGGPVDGPKGPPQTGSVSYGRPFRPFSDIDRYADGDWALDEAYKKGLASVIYELYDRPKGHGQYLEGYRGYYQKYDRRPMKNNKYGLYDPSPAYYARSINSNVTDVSQH